MARRKIIFVIVEGPSDDEALGVILSRFYDKNSVYVEIVHGDITSERSVTSSNISARIGNIVKAYANSNHYKQSDFERVIHLVDMDGAYVNNEVVIYDPNIEKTFYSVTEIRTSNREGIINRNERKRSNIDKICSINNIWKTIPYKVYYMSANLDHVLYDKLNSSDGDKEIDAYNFAKKYKDDLTGFLTFMSMSDFSVHGDFKETWEYIKKEKHSLERHTNFGLCFDEVSIYNEIE